MLTLEVNLKDVGARAGIADVIRACTDREELHKAMADEVEGKAQEHLQNLNSRSPNTGFYARAAKSTEVTADAAGAKVGITQRGFALRYYGGRVLPGKSISSFTGQATKALAIPTENVPLSAGKEGRLGPREVGILAFLPSKKSAGTIGVLVEGEEVARKRKSGTRIQPKEGGRLMFVLRSWTDHEKDESVLPTLASLITAATDAAQNFIEATTTRKPTS